VYYTGTDELQEGYALCYNFDSIDRSAENISLASGQEGADDESPARHIQVEKPSMENAMWFAGVVSAKYAGFTGPGYIEINMPGSICNIWCNANVDHAEETLLKTTTGTGIATGQIVTFGTNSYAFTYAGCGGEGSAMVLQDVDRSSTAGLVQAKLQAGMPSGGFQNCYSVNSSTYMAAATSAVGVAFSTGGSVHVPKCGVTQISYSVATADWTSLVSRNDGQWVGQTKIFKIADSDVLGAAALTAGIDYLVTVSLATVINTSLVGSDVPGSATVVFSLDTANDTLKCVWNGTSWEATQTGDLGA
jgi:hypothetical protein